MISFLLHLINSVKYFGACRLSATRKPGFKPLESRLAMATFALMNTADSGVGSLWQAILNANANLAKTTSNSVRTKLDVPELEKRISDVVAILLKQMQLTQ